MVVLPQKVKQWILGNQILKLVNPLGHATIVIVQAQDIKRDTGPVGSGK